MSLVVCGFFVAGRLIDSAKIDKVDGFCKTSDTLAPEISMNGGEIITLILGNEYEDPGASAVDDCDAVELTSSGEVDINTIGSYKINYESSDNSGNHAIKTRTVNIVPANRGNVYLTFDDGPGDYTATLLDILKKYNVKATFFVTGRGDDSLILREYQEGHAIGLHTLSHNYAYVYSSVDNFFSDLVAVQNRVKNITGETTYLMRFPGGSSNTVSYRYDGRTHIMSRLVSEVEARGYKYFDWNITSGDAGETTDTGTIVARVTSALHDGENIVLQHDIKDYSVAAVESIIQYGLANGFVFKPLTMDSFGAHHGVNN